MTALSARGVALSLQGQWRADGPAPWVSLVTGLYPETHGIWRSQEAWAGGRRPIGHASWRATPLWERLAAAGLQVGSVAWPAVRPASAWSGIHIDRGYAIPSGRTREAWALPLDSVPPEGREALRDLRVHPTEITGDMLAPLVPGLAAMDQSRDTGLPQLAVAMAQAGSVQAASAWLLERRPDAAFVHHEWLGVVSAAFETYREGVFSQVVDGAWRFLDGLVGRLAELAGPDTLAVVASPGWRNRPGALIAAGPGASGEAEGPRWADLMDVAPTLLAAIGYEDATLPGRAIPALAPPGDRQPAPQVPPRPPPRTDTQLLQQAIDAGYGAPAPPSAAWQAQGLTELAMLLLQREPKMALAAAEAALALDPRFAPALDAKAIAHVLLDEAEPLADLADALARTAPDRGWGPLARAAGLVMQGCAAEAVAHIREAERDLDPEFRLRIAAVWYAAGRPEDAGRIFRELLQADPANAAAHVGLAAVATARRDLRAAEESLTAAISFDPGHSEAWRRLADLYRQTGRPGESERAARVAAGGARGSFSRA